MRSYFASIHPPTRQTFGFVSVGVLFYIFRKGHSFISFFLTSGNDATNQEPERRRAGGGHLGKLGLSGVFIQATVQRKNEMK
ncbi:hypothetical protein AMTR_s00027p00096520 [Amborella trichopoda]|uniref:Uncharacterized protein n=1 Tax=Amborella trichopoda TaxID=13333 RepID=W1PSR1_AMBTC|nr:hypothetical protein AMTR_s00027p00096520 [Amborella trichopoda]